MTRREGLALVVTLVLSLGLAGCASREPVDGPPGTSTAVPGSLPGDPVPREEPRSSYGNGPIYEVLGKRYQVMDTSHGYQERGVASWYGNKFHGRLTSSREPYDMYEMTAAHKTLPLPTYVRVRNLSNNRSVVVRVNDRGPFVSNRIIDLSYSAAIKLDMVRDGTSLVEVTAISFDQPPEIIQANVPAATAAGSEAVEPAGANIYVQVGAFGDPKNAHRRFELLRSNGIRKAFVYEETGRSPALYRVRIGPIASVDQYDSVVANLERIGIAETHLVTE